MTSKDTILVVGDTPANLKLLVDTVMAEGYQVLLAESGELALESVAARPPELILLNIRMPGLDGFDVLRRLKASEKSRDIPVVFISANVDIPERVEGLKLGAVDFITKPFQREELLARLQTHLELRRLRVQLEQQADGLRRANAQLQAEIAERKQSETHRQLVAEALRLLNRPNDLPTLVADLVRLIKQATGFEAVGLRLREGDDFPYYVARGFPETFLQAERYLCARDQAGELVRDAQGNPVLECMCGNNLCGRTNPALPFSTTGGSFWTNGTSQLLATTTEADRAARTRNRCNREGYESVGLIPLRSGGEIIGLLQLSDHRPGRFTPELVRLFESMADGIGVGLKRAQVIEVLQESEDKFKYFFEHSNVGKSLTRPSGEVQVNRAFCDLLGYSPAELQHQTWQAITHPEDVEPTQRAVEALLGRRQDSIRFTKRYLHKNGSVVWADLSTTLRRDAAGQPLYFITSAIDITARKLAEEHLRASEARYRLLHESMMDAFVEVDLSGRILEWNRAYCAMLGYSDEELRQLTYQELTPERWRAFEARIVAEEVFPKGASGVYEKEYRRKDGTVFPVEMSAFLLRDDAGEPTGIWGIARDITQRKQAEEQLRASEEHAHELSRFNQGALDALTAHICVLASDGTILAVNEAWRSFAAANPPLSAKADVGGNYLAACESVGGEDAGMAREVVQGLRAVARGDLPEFSIEYPCHSPDTQRWFMARATRFAGAGPVRLVVAHLNITSRRQAEAEVRRQQAELAAIFENSPVMMCLVDANRQVLRANHSFAQPAGQPGAELVGQSLGQVLGCARVAEAPTGCGSSPNCPACPMLRLVGETFQSGQSRRQVEGRLLITHGGQPREHSLNCSTARLDVDGQSLVLLCMEDVTDKKLTEAKLLRAQRVESIGSLASGIAHDLNNILAPIVMCAPLLQEEDTLENRREMAQTIESSAGRAVGIVKQLLSFARGKEGQKSALQVRHLIHDMAKIAREVFPRSIKLEVACATELWLVMGDATQLHQVLLNLCVNARDAMPAGGTLTLGADNVTLDEHYVSMHREATPGPFVRIQVQDTGTGIPDDVREHIFGSFFTTKGEDQGTGLGLTTVLGIVRDHKGFMTFTSVPGRGTTFVVHLPASPEALSSAETVPSSQGIPEGRGELVLVVDDEPAIRDTTRRTLQRHGYEVLTAYDGIEALAQFSLHQNTVRVVLTDYMMPLMDGPTLCRTLRRLSPGTPIIVSSGGLFGKVGAEALRTFEELRIRHILEKPHNADDLLRALDETLHMSKAAPDGKAHS